MNTFDLKKALQTAIIASELASRELLKGYGNEFNIYHKSDNDLVTDCDISSEEIIKKTIMAEFPEHAIIAEEGGLSGKNNSQYRWYIDPLDGTTNFVHSYPFFAVSIGLYGPDSKGVTRPLLGVINAPVLKELFWAAHEMGAWHRNNILIKDSITKKLSVSKTTNLNSSMINTGFPHDQSKQTEAIKYLNELLMKTRTVRRTGSAALDLAYVAAGKADALWHSGLKPWDVAAGIILITEAGGKVSEALGTPYVIEKSEVILASNSIIHPQMVKLCAFNKM